VTGPGRTNVGSAGVQDVAALAFVLSSAGIGACVLTLLFNQAEFLALGTLPLLAGVLAALAWRAHIAGRSGIGSLLVVAIACGVAGVALRAAPEAIWGLHLDMIMHRSLATSMVGMALCVGAACVSIYQYMGATPSALDYSRYPILLVPAILTLGVYAGLIGYLLVKGLPNLSWEIITTPYQFLQWDEMVYEKGWPVWESHSIRQVGMWHQVQGTLLLMGLTSLFALPAGIGVGVLLGEYSDGWFATVVRYSVNILRAMSVFILGVTAVSIVSFAAGTPLSDLLCGFYYDPLGGRHVGHGSYVTAALLLALLVIPVVARSTEEGCRSLPHDLREGSLALGATEGHTLTRIILPWSAPNIVTAVLLGCAEAAGSVAVIVFIARMGQYGVNPLNEVTSLSQFIFEARWGTHAIEDAIRPYQFSAGVLLLGLTMGLSAAALALRHHFAYRYRSR